MALATDNGPVKLELDRPAARFTTDDIITGRVRYDFKKPCDLCEVTITLRGKVETKYRSGNNKRAADRRILYKQVRLHRGPVREDRPNEWDFAIPIPLTVPMMRGSHIDEDKPVRGERDRYCRDEHPLPPSTAAFNDGLNQIYGRVAYSLKASATHLNVRAKTYDQKRDIVFLPSSPIPVQLREGPCPTFLKEDFPIKTLRLLPEHSQGVSLRDKTRSLFHSKDIPLWRMRITSELPTRAYPGGPLELILRLEHLSDNPKHITAPDVRLRSLRLRLLARTYVQFERTFFSSNESELITSSVWIRESRDQSRFLLDRNYLKVFKWDIGAHVPPDFETSYMRRTHIWNLEYNVECLGKTFFCNRLVPIKLEPMPASAASAESEDVIDVVDVADLDVTRPPTPPPPYEEVA